MRQVKFKKQVDDGVDVSFAVRLARTVINGLSLHVSLATTPALAAIDGAARAFRTGIAAKAIRSPAGLARVDRIVACASGKATAVGIAP